MTLPARRDIAETRFQPTQLRTIEATLRLNGRRATPIGEPSRSGRRRTDGASAYALSRRATLSENQTHSDSWRDIDPERAECNWDPREPSCRMANRILSLILWWDASTSMYWNSSFRCTNHVQDSP